MPSEKSHETSTAGRDLRLRVKASYPSGSILRIVAERKMDDLA